MQKLGLLINLVCNSHEMERTSRGGGRVSTNLTESHEMRRNGEELSPFWKFKLYPTPSMRTSPHLVGSHEMTRNGEKLSPFWKWRESQEKLDFFKTHCKNLWQACKSLKIERASKGGLEKMNPTRWGEMIFWKEEIPGDLIKIHWKKYTYKSS